VTGTRKQTKKEKLTTLAFKMISILHNTLLATPKLKFYFGAFPHFWGPPNAATTIFMGLNSNFNLGEFVLLGSLPNSNFSPEAFAHFGGPTGVFLGFRGRKSNFTLGHLSFWEYPNLRFYSGAFAPFGVLGPKIKFDFGAFIHR
jgi:hypothetical protein